MELEFREIAGDVRAEVRDCQFNKHIQQVAYSTYHDALTQICFTCNKVRTSINPDDLKQPSKSEKIICKNCNDECDCHLFIGGSGKLCPDCRGKSKGDKE